MSKGNIKVLVAVLISVLLVISVVFYAFAVSESDLEKLQKEAEELADQIKDLEKDIAQAKADKKAALKIKNQIDQKIELIEKEITNKTEIINAYSEAISEKESEISDLEKKQSEEYQLFLGRVRAMEEMGTQSYWTCLLTTDSLGEFLSMASIISDILSYDRAIMQELDGLQKGLEEAKLSLENSKRELEEAKYELVEQEKGLEKELAAADKLINDLEHEYNDYVETYEDAEEAMEQLQKEILEMETELENAKYVGGDYLWPVEGYHTITSKFGMRLHPILKVYKLHTGVDVKVPKGVPIMAANDGVVVTAGYNTGYGNYVVIDHGGGQKTLYAHMTKYLVKKGQTVERGDKIGTVGSTGYSTGAHLHFEIIIDGEQVDPMQFFD